MFFLSNGDCAVNIKDETGREHIAVKLLMNGDHFGELALIYKCRRTATVVSRNYNTMARLTYPQLRSIINEYPLYLKYLKQYLFHYDDEKKKFLLNLIKKVFYFKAGLKTQDYIHDTIYSLKPVFYERGTIILKEQEVVKTVMFIEHGMVEVYTEFEGNEFLIDRLYEGSVINYRTFLMDDIMSVNIRAVENVNMLELNH